MTVAVVTTNRSTVDPLAGPPTSTGAPLPPVVALNDDDLASELTRLAQEPGEVCILANAYTVCLFQRAPHATAWQPVCKGDFSDRAAAVAKAHGRRLLWGRVTGLPWEADPASTPTAPVTTLLLRLWLKTATQVTTGRQGEATARIRDELRYLAGWRCQFAGCGRDLHQHGATGASGQFSYFAHIVAASPDGPRGDPVLSPALAAELSNFMLLCDECHRRIDKTDPARFTVPILQRMREDSIAEVRRLLNTLAFPATDTIAIIGNITGQSAQFSIDDAHEALWASKLRTTNTKPERYFSPGGQHHEVHTPAYWTSLFQQMRRELPLLQTMLEGTRNGTARPRLAIFPQHSTSVLVLSGRVLGDSAGTYLFQPHRNASSNQTRWAWPTGAPVPAADKYRVKVLQSPKDEAAACLLVTLTADITWDRLPTTCAVNDALVLPTLQIVGPTFDKHCIQHPDDLTVFGQAIDEAMRILQDRWRVRTVHLVICAPASAVVVVGQKMQARHQADYLVYEALSGPGSAYQATIELTSALVRELVSGQGHSHPLQA